MRIGITGISGSFGSALCADLAADPSHTIVGIARDELRAEQIMARYRRQHDNVRVMVIAAGLADEDAMNRVFKGCDLLVHAAALKRISGSVYATEELVKTNVIGTMHVLEVARKQGIQKTLIISSDKACEATNLYGSTKFTAECLAVQSNAFIFPSTGGIVSCVRWGNVLGSRGSVLHIWRRQRDEGKPLTMTDPDMTRFLITMPQAVAFTRLILRDLRGGEIFVPLLRATTMTQLARAVWLERAENRHLLAPPSCPTTVTGLRPGGEKRHEILLTQEEPARSEWYRPGGLNSQPVGIVVRPSHCTWTEASERHDPLPAQFASYSSAHAEQIPFDELAEIVARTPYTQEERT